MYVTALYLRQSIDDPDGIDRQRDILYPMCSMHAWENTKEYVDLHESATPETRKGKPRRDFARLWADVEAGRVERIVVTVADRLYRHPRELEDIIDHTTKHSVPIWADGVNLNLATDAGRLVARILGANARGEIERKFERQRDAMKQIATAEGGGRPWWPHRPFGFDADSDPITGRWWTSRKRPGAPTIYNEIRHHPLEAPLIKDAYSDVLVGTSLYAIAKRWNDAGVLTPFGKKWIPTQVKYCLMAARNAGLRELNGVVVGPGTWDKIVTEEVWRQTVAKLSDPSRSTGTYTRARKYLLPGLLICGRCGDRLVSQTGAKSGYKCYECRGCSKIAREMRKLDALITKAVVDRLARPDAIDLLLPQGEEVDVVGLREQRRALVERLKQLGTEFKDAPIEFTRAAVASAQADIEAIDAQLTDSEQANVYEGVIGADDVAQAFADLDLDRKRTVIDALMTVTVHPIVKGSGRRFDPTAIDVRWK